MIANHIIVPKMYPPICGLIRLIIPTITNMITSIFNALFARRSSSGSLSPPDDVPPLPLNSPECLRPNCHARH